MLDGIDLGKIDILRERMGVTYREAKEVLERTRGDLLAALIELEGEGKSRWTEEFTVKSNEAVEKVKELIHQGQVTKIRVKHEGKVLVDIPVAMGAVGAVFLPQLAALGALAAVFRQCTIEVIKKTDAGDSKVAPKVTVDENDDYPYGT
ncbi:MAG TPA: DUF4342 domain-containing protein [Patescibacteria group bacterium]|nr:DUF4342 domain-containing protein [Patescibacteria group bacterium]